MTDSIYPSQLDNDQTLPRVDANISEISPDAINSLRSAVFNIEEALGVDPQGTATDLATRITVSLNLDGSLKASALAAVGLVTLPIINSMISDSAGIEESKLDLNYATVQLKTWIDENRVRINSTTNHLAYHTAHPSTWGRHNMHDIDGYGAFAGSSLDEVLDTVDDKIDNHISDTTDAHAASAISFDSSNVPFSANNVQDAIDSTEERTQSATLGHQELQHSNGVLRAQEVSYNGTDHSFTLVESSTINALTVGDSSVTFSSAPTGFDEVSRGDRIDITVNGNTYVRYVDTTSSTDTINFLGVIPESATSGTAIIYQSSVESLAPAAVNFGIRQLNVSESGGSVIQLVHHSAPYALGSNMDVRGLQDSSTRNIKIGWGSGNTSDLNIYTLMGIFNVNPSTWTAENLAIVLNETFRGTNNFPLVAFTYKGELGLAVDEPDGYVELMAPSSNSAWSILGFTEGEIAYQLDRKLFIDGYDYTTIRKMVTATATVEAGNPNLLDNISENVKASGVKAPGIVRVKNAVSTDNGTYLFTQVNSETSITVSEHTFTPTATGTTVDVEIYSDSFAVSSAPTNKTFYELFLDGYTDGAELRGVERLEYYKTSGSSQDTSSYFDITDVSRTFPESERRIIYTITSGTITMALGTRGAGLTLDRSGPEVTLPAATSTIVGYKFKLIDYNGTDYVNIEVVTSYSILTTGNALDIDVLPRPNEKRYLQISKTLHNKIMFKHLDDRRLFGNVGRADVRDDFTRDYTSYPRSLVRGNGIIRGFDITNGTTSITIDGGEVLVNGFIYNITQKVYDVPEDNVTTTYNVFIDTNGILRFLQDDQYIEGIISSPSVSEIIASDDKTIVAQIEVNSSNNITSVTDLRRYVGNLDNKIELIVDDDMSHGTFATLESAVNYIILQGSSSSSSVIIRIRGEVYHDVSNTLSVPMGITIEGETTGFGSPTFGTKLILTGTGTTAFSFGTGCTLRNLRVQMDSSSFIESLIGNASTNLSYLTIDNCQFTGLISSGAIYFIRANTLTNFFMNRTQVELDSSNGDGIGISTVTNLSSCIILNSKVNFSTTTNNQMIIDANGLVSDLYFNNFSSLFLSASGNNTFCEFISTTNKVHFVKCNLLFPSTSGTNIAVSGTGNITDMICQHCDITWDIGASSFINTTGELNELLIDTCQFIFNASSYDNTFISSGQIIDGLINNVKVNYASTTGTNVGFNITGTNKLRILNSYFAYGANGTGRFIYSSADLDYLWLDNNLITFGSTTDDNTFIFVSGDMDDCNVEKCIVTFPTSSGTSTGIQCTDITNFAMNDTNLVFTTAASGNYGLYATTATNCKLLNCKISEVDKVINVGTLTKGIINNCDLLETLSAIDIDGGSDISIYTNTIQTSEITSSFISIADVDNLNIFDNNIQYLDAGTDTPSVAMLNVYQCNNYSIHNNNLLNKDSLTQGALGAITVDCLADSYGVISENIIKYFKYASGYAVNLDGQNITCSNNKIVGCRKGFDLIDVKNSTFIGNHIDLSTGDNGVNVKGFYTGGNSDNIVFSGNTILSDEATLNTSARLIDYSSGTPTNLSFTNNILKTSASSSTAEPVKIKSTNLIFSNNIIDGGDFTGGTAPLWIQGGDTNGLGATISNNQFNVTYNTTDSPLAFNTYDVDFMNRGQIYNVVIPMTRAAYNSTSGWEYLIDTDPSRVVLYNANTSNGEVGIEFTSSDLPVGVELSTVKLYVNVSTTTDVAISLREIDWNSGTGTELVAPANPTGTGFTTLTITPPSETFVAKNKSYNIYAKTDSAALTDVYIYSVYLTYKL